MAERYDPRKARPEPMGRFCWIVDGDRKSPALLLEWRRLDDGRWEGLVASVDEHPATRGLTVRWVPGPSLKAAHLG